MTDKIREQILDIRNSGVTNMFDGYTVQRIAYEKATSSLFATLKNTPIPM